MYSSGKSGLVGVFSAFALNDYVRGNHFSEVVHNEFGKDLLNDVLRLFAVKIKETERVLKMAKRGFDSPTQGVKLL